MSQNTARLDTIIPQGTEWGLIDDTKRKRGFLSLGDIFKTDDSWLIRSINAQVLHVEQILDRDQSPPVVEYGLKETSLSEESFKVFGGTPTVRNKYFIALKVSEDASVNVNPDHKSVRAPKHRVIAQECDSQGNIKTDEITIQFAQAGLHTNNVYKTEKTNRRPVLLGPCEQPTT